MFTAIEHRVEIEGRLDFHEVDLMATTNQLTPLGAQVLVAFVKQSERVVVKEEGELIWLEPNPAYEPLIEEADTDVKELIIPDDDSEL